MRFTVFVLCVGLCPVTGAAEDSPPTLTQAWARDIEQLDYDDLSEQVRRKVLWTLTDAIGVLFYSRKLEIVRRFAQVTGPGDRAEAWDWATDRRVAAEHAAAINAFTIHGHEISDSNLRNQLRASCSALPAPWAVAEARNVSGRELITALAVSYHVSDRLATYTNVQPAGRLHRKGYMPSSMCGAIGSAAGAAKLMNLDAEQIASAMALASAGANGLFQYYYEGSDEKKVHVARSQALAVQSARLAEAGFVGASRALEGPAGFLTVLGYDIDRNALIHGFDRFDGILHVKPKFYACSQGVIPWIEAIDAIRRTTPFNAQHVEKVELHLNHPPDDPLIQRVNNFHPPDSLMGAQLSQNYGIALFILRGDAFVDNFTDHAIDDPRILELARKVIARSNPQEDGGVRIHLTDGRILRGFYDRAALIEPYALEPDRYRRKFDRLTAPLTAQQTAALREHIFSLDRAQHVREWIDQLLNLAQTNP